MTKWKRLFVGLALLVCIFLLYAWYSEPQWPIPEAV
jgi:hypothetical protein